jgi:hypothetical protein
MVVTQRGSIQNLLGHHYYYHRGVEEHHLSLCNEALQFFPINNIPNFEIAIYFTKK